MTYLTTHTTRRRRLIGRIVRKSTVGLVAVAASALIALTPIVPSVSAATATTESARQMAGRNAGVELRVTLNRLSQEHVYLAGAATGAAIAGRDAEARAALAELDENSVATAQGIGAVYGPEAEAQFLTLWRAHIGFFADYATAAAKNDQAGKQQARASLDGYRADIDTLLTGANPNLPKGAVAELFKHHVEHLTGAIDAQAAGNATQAFDMLHMAAHQSRDISDALVDAIVAQFPERFGATAMVGADSMTTTTQVTPLLPGREGMNMSNDHPRNDDENSDE